MNKAEFIEKFAEKNKLSIKLSKSIVDIILHSIEESLISKERIEIRGFGSFYAKEYKSYQGRNPKTGEKIKVDKKLAPFFKVSKACKTIPANESGLQDRLSSLRQSSKAEK